MKKLLVFLCTMLLAFGICGNADANLITNPGFETNNFTGWTVTDVWSGSFFIDDNDGVTPVSNSPTVGPASGSYYAVSDQDGPGAHALSQNFTVPGSATSMYLSFDMFVQNETDVDCIVGNGLNPAGEDTNQHARVDILDPSVSDPWEVGTGVVYNFYIGADVGENPLNWTFYSFDISSIVEAGRSYTLRFAEVNNSGWLNMGIDNVRIDTEPIPEPATVLLLGTGLVGLAGFRKKFKK